MSKKTIEEYRAEVEARPFETHTQYRNRVGRQKRHAALMASKPKYWERDVEIKAFKEACKRIEEKVAAEVKALREARDEDSRRAQYMYDFERGAYGRYKDVDEVPNWITGIYRSMHGIEEEKTEATSEFPSQEEDYVVIGEDGSFDIDEEE